MNKREVLPINKVRTEEVSGLQEFKAELDKWLNKVNEVNQ